MGTGRTKGRHPDGQIQLGLRGLVREGESQGGVTSEFHGDQRAGGSASMLQNYLAVMKENKASRPQA